MRIAFLMLFAVTPLFAGTVNDQAQCEALKKSFESDPLTESKTSALSALKRLEENKATQESYKTSLTQFATKGKAVNPDDVAVLWEGGQCSAVLLYFSTFRRLIEEADKYNFSPGEKKRLVNAVFRHVDDETKEPNNLFSILMSISLVKALSDKKLIEPVIADVEALAALEDKAKKTREETISTAAKAIPPDVAKTRVFKEVPQKHRRKFASLVTSELGRSELLRGEFRAMFVVGRLLPEELK